MKRIKLHTLYKLRIIRHLHLYNKMIIGGIYTRQIVNSATTIKAQSLKIGFHKFNTFNRNRRLYQSLQRFAQKQTIAFIAKCRFKTIIGRNAINGVSKSLISFFSILLIFYKQRYDFFLVFGYAYCKKRSNTAKCCCAFWFYFVERPY